MQNITVHSPGCVQLVENELSGFHVGTEELEVLAKEIYGIMSKENIPFYRVQPHSPNCPGPRFPWEDLEHMLFTFSH